MKTSICGIRLNAICTGNFFGSIFLEIQQLRSLLAEFLEAGTACADTDW
jgi:hypothetical protein